MLPSMVTKSPILNERSSPINVNTSPSAALNLTRIVREPTLMVSSTAALVLLMRRPSRPLTPPANEPESTPAMPALVTTNPPSPFVRLWPPKLTLRFATPTRVNFAPPAFVICSNAKSPRNSGPPAAPMRKVAPSTSTRTYGPAGTFTVTVAPDTTSASFTAVVPVLIASFTVPPLSVTPGTLITGLTVNDAATPPDVITSRPLPFVTDTNVFVPSPSVSPRFVTPTRTTLTPAPVVACSSTKLPDKLWPATVSVTPVPVTRT